MLDVTKEYPKVTHPLIGFKTYSSGGATINVFLDTDNTVVIQVGGLGSSWTKADLSEFLELVKEVGTQLK